MRCDANSVVLGVILEISGVEMADAAYLMKKEGFNHINVVGLDVMLKDLK